ncbi:MAG: SDR family NAD(P)-dependent oxidoreductase [Bacteroidetes bacterium]|nr:SDR family NAD(P)-dependent oxidoreductase [Bacteroidota bacterium]
MKIGGNTILITGATSGIGLAFAEEFYKAGSKVIVCGRREDRLKQLGEKYPGMITKICDVSVTDQRKELAAWVIKEYPETNIIMNNAGIQLTCDMTQEVDLDRVYAEVDTNLIAPLHIASLFAPHLKTKQDAAIINISSGLAFVPLAFMPVYCATKAAIHSLTLSLRHQLRDTSVKVFEIAPPSTDTELGHDRRPDKTQTHGGLPISEFITEAMEAIKNDTLEAPIAHSKVLHAKREEMFEQMNSRF